MINSRPAVIFALLYGILSSYCLTGVSSQVTPGYTPTIVTPPPAPSTVIVASTVTIIVPPAPTPPPAIRIVRKAARRKRDPLILDTDKNGSISAALNTGISLNPKDWTERTGGATGGDKMLAMCDLNKNGVIDGTEVFGDLTQFPLFTNNEPIENGFIAIRKVARSLEQKFNDTIVQYHNGSHYVVLDALQASLKKLGCDLGLISGDNRDPSKLEPLGDVLGIDISRWTVNATESPTGISEKHQGNYIDKLGTQWRVSNVWFQTQTSETTQSIRNVRSRRIF